MPPAACRLPLMMFTIGTGSTGWRPSPRCCHSSRPATAAPARAQATDAATMVFAPSRSRRCVPSASISRASMAAWSPGSRPASAGLAICWAAATAA